METLGPVKEKPPVNGKLPWESDDADDRPGFQIRDLLRFFAVDVILIMFIRLLLGMGFFPDVDTYVAGILTGKVVLLLYLVWLVRHRNNAWREAGASSAGRPWAWPVCIVGYAAVFPLLIHLEAINRVILQTLYEWADMVYRPQPQDVIILIFEDILATPMRGVLILFTVAVGPAMEELAFRGLGMDAFRRARGTVWAVIWTSLLFGLYHFSLDLLIPLTALGAIFAAARLVSRSLWCGVMVHCLHNTVTLLLMAREINGFGADWW
ncbi:MAG: CPBP family intramembrane metalloprotease [Planctomycetes bacterium]|nr:CPBP family intramembrane metalloprotease [Planctomycetota bacterium]